MKLIRKIQGKILLGTVSVSTLFLTQKASAVPILCGSTGPNSNCNIAGLETNIHTDFSSMAKLFYLGAGIIGVALIIVGLLKLKAHSMDSQGTSGHLRSAIWLLIIGALMLAVPVIMMLGSSSITGDTVTMTSENGLFS